MPADPVPPHIAVVGAGMAGARTTLELRAQGFTGRVTLIGAEQIPPYDRPPLSTELFERTTPAWLSEELGADAMAAADRVLLGSQATGLVLTEGRPVLRLSSVGSDGPHSELSADAVVIATGATPIRPWPTAVTLRTAADAGRLRRMLTDRPRRLVIVGAGWIGAEVASAAALTGMRVTVLEAGPTPLPALGAEVGELVAAWFAHATVALHTGATVTSVQDMSVTLADGEVFPADVLLAAVGVRPTTDWLAEALPREPDGAVLVDEWFSPLNGPPTVRLVGDVARRRSTRHGWVSGGHWDAAFRGPAVAVRGLLAELAGTTPGPPEDSAPYTFSTQFGRDLTLFGSPAVGDELLLRGDPREPDGWSALWFSPGTDTLTAVFTVDRPRDVAGARRLFAGAALPELNRMRASDPGTPLRETLRESRLG